MPFEAKHTRVDLDLDFSDSDVKIEDGEDPIIRPIKLPTGENVKEWGKMLIKPLNGINHRDKTEEQITAEMSEKHKNDPNMAADILVKNIDFWYHKGKKWWLERVPFAMLQDIVRYLNEQVFQLKKNSKDLKPSHSLSDTATQLENSNN